MFVVRSEQVVNPSQVGGYEAYRQQAALALVKQRGFLRELRLTSVDDPHRRQVYQLWEDQHSREAFSRSPRWVRTPPHLLLGPAVTGYYHLEASAQPHEPEPGACVLDRELRVGNGRQAEFETVERGLCALAKDQPGFVSRRILKFIGNDTSYVRLSVWLSWGAVEHWRTTTEYQCENDALSDAVVWTEARRYRVNAVLP